MPKDLIFSIDQDVRGKELFLIVHISEKNSSRIVYFSDLKELAKTDKELVSLLLQESGKVTNLETTSCQKVAVRASLSLELLQKLILSKRFLWKNRSLFFNPLLVGKSAVSFEVEQEKDTLLVSGFFHLEGEKVPVESVDFLFLGDPVWGIAKQMVFVLPKGIKKSWLDFVYPEPKILEGKQKDRFLEDYQEDPPEDFPKMQWIGETAPKEMKLSVFPCLVLKDAYGAFADLNMEYETRKVDFADPVFFTGRNIDMEKAWEKDLLETDFIIKIMPTSRYYCPMDKIVQSLSFLLEIGWKIFDRTGKQVLKMESSHLSLTTKDDKIVVKGSLKYGEHKANIQDVVGAFNRRGQFLDLSPSHVALLDPSQHREIIEDLEEAELCSEGCLLSKKKGGVLGDFLERKDVSCDEETRSLLDRLKYAEQKEDQFSLENFKGELRPYQKEGVAWLCFLHNNQFSGLLGDEMGLGKTVQILAFLSQIYSGNPILIVVPTSLLFNWKKEWDLFLTGKDLYVHSGNKRSLDPLFLSKQAAVLTSYAQLRIDFLLFEKISFACTILDEAQCIKNPESQIARVCYRLRSAMKIVLTGTPVENRADDLWSLFHFLEPELLGERKDFLASLQASGLDSRHKQRIAKKLRPFILRRLKEAVAQDLPEKLEQTIWVEMKEEQRSFYEKWLFKTKSGLLKKVSLDGVSSHRMEILEAILRLRQICCHPHLVDSDLEFQETASGKLERVLEDLEEVVAEGRKVLVYSQFTKMLFFVKREIQQRGWKFAYLDGETKDREAEVTSFQTDRSVQIFLISLKAGGVGLNLTQADYVFLLDPWWNEAVERQAIDRAHRLGRKGSVIARRYVMAESIEEKMMKLKTHKVSLAEELLELDGHTHSLDLEQMIDLLV